MTGVLGSRKTAGNIVVVGGRRASSKGAGGGASSPGSGHPVHRRPVGLIGTPARVCPCMGPPPLAVVVLLG